MTAHSFAVVVVVDAIMLVSLVAAAVALWSRIKKIELLATYVMA